MRPTAPHVVGIDFSDASARALRAAAGLALTAAAPLHVVHADETQATARAVGSDVLLTDLRAFVRRTFEGMQPGVRITYAIARDLSPGLALSSYAKDVEARLLVVGTHGRRGLKRLLLGSVAEEVVRTAPCHVMTIPDPVDEASSPVNRPVLAPVDFSLASEEGLRLARMWATRLNAPLVLLHVIDAGPYPAFYLPDLAEGYTLTQLLDERARKRLPRFYAQAVHGTDFGPECAEADGIQAETAVGRADVEIAAFAEEIGARLIVMATRGLTGLEHVLLGSTAERTLRRAPCPVLTLRPSPTADSPGDAAAVRADARALLEADLHLP
ncbi:MAG: universal stress protein [Bacteroidota bacterium]